MFLAGGCPGTLPRPVQLPCSHKGCVVCKTEGQAVPSSPPPAPLLILSLVFCLSFPFLSIFGPSQPFAAFVLVLSGSPDLLPWFLFPFPEDGGLFFSAGAPRVWGTLCAQGKPLAFPRGALLSCSRTFNFFQACVFCPDPLLWSWAGLFVLGKLIAAQ